MEITGIILAGGKSSRFGTDKCKMRLGSFTLIEIIISKLQTICNEIIISENNSMYNNNNCYSQADEISEIGPLGGIYSALKKARNEKCLVVSCDSPFVSVKYLEKMISLSQNFDITFANEKNKLHLVTGAIYNKSVINAIEKQIAEKNYKLMNLTNYLNCNIVNIEQYAELYDEYLLTNINNINDYEKVKNIFENQINIKK